MYTCALFFHSQEVSHVRTMALIIIWMLANHAATCGQQGPLVLPEDSTAQRAVDALPACLARVPG